MDELLDVTFQTGYEAGERDFKKTVREAIKRIIFNDDNGNNVLYTDVLIRSLKL